MMTNNRKTCVYEEIQRLARESAERQPHNESIWLLTDKTRQLRVYITCPSVSEIRGLTGYCTVAIARNMRRPSPQDVICKWAYDICGEIPSVDRALDVIKSEVDYIANSLTMGG